LMFFSLTVTSTTNIYTLSLHDALPIFEIGEHVGEEGEEPVADGVPEVEDAMRAALEPRAEHGVGASVGDGGEQGRELGGIVLEVGVLDHDHVARGLPDPRADGRPLRSEEHTSELQSRSDLVCRL